MRGLRDGGQWVRLRISSDLRRRPVPLRTTQGVWCDTRWMMGDFAGGTGLRERAAVTGGRLGRWVGGLLSLAVGLLGAVATPSVQAAAFDFSTPSCLSADCTQMGSITRYANAVTGAAPRDILLTIVRGNGATVNQAPDTQMAYLSSTRVFNGRIAGDANPSAKSQLVMRLTFVTPGTTTANPLTGSIYLTSHDTDGNGNPTLGVRERVEFISPPASFVAGPQLVVTTALDGGIAYATALCANSTDDGCSPSTGVSEGSGGYANYTDLSVTTAVAVTAWYNGAITSIDFAYGAEVGSSGTGGNPISNRLFGLSGGMADAADMSPAFSGIPSVIRPGQVLTGLTLTCTNSASAAAAAAMGTCVPSVNVGTVSAVSCSPLSGSSNIAAGASIVCTFTYTAPGTQGGGDEATTSATFTGTTGAFNDTNPSNDTTTFSATMIDALDESTSTAYGTAASLTVLNNDQVGTGAASFSNVTLSAVGSATTGSSFNVSTGVFSVPATAAPGTYSQSYQICANPAVTPAACDTATATIVVGPAADMGITLGTIPTAIRPGQVLTGLTYTCANAAGGAAASSPSCSLSASAGTVSAVSCSPTLGASLSAGASVVCSYTYTAPGTQGGTDEATTSVTFTGTTGATNDNNPANDTASASTTMIDALDESTSTAYGTAASLTVLSNDQVGTGAASFSNVTLSAVGAATTGSSFNASTGVFSVPATAAPGTYSQNYQICANPAVTPAACDTATATIVVGPAADMAASISGVPAAVRPGQVISGVKLTCTNVSATTAATAASCALGAVSGATASTPVCTPQPGGTVAAGGVIQCVFNLTVNGTQGGGEESTTTVSVAGSTNATNDSNAANNNASVSAPLIDAVDDVDSKPGGSTGQSSTLSTNDKKQAGSIFSIVSGGSCANASVSSAGVATYDVPASGSCTVKYQLCAASPNQSTCDNATLTVTALPADMSVTVTGLPAVVSPGQSIDNVTLTCRNAVGGAAATAPTCDLSADVGSLIGQTCTPTAVPATLAAGAEIVCRFRYTAPGTPGGGSETRTSVVLTGRTSATNDSDPTNNSASVSARVVDAVDDARVTVAITGGTVSLWTNDRLGGAAVAATSVTTTLTSDGGLTGASLNALGQVVVPAGVARGSYALTYRLCSVETPAACDTAAVTIDILGQPDLAVTKTHSPQVFLEGGEGTYRIAVTNVGDAASSGLITVTDSLPAGLTVASKPTGSGWDCGVTVVGSAQATCTRSDALAAAIGGTATAAPVITLTVKVAAGACQAPDANGLCTGALVNTVKVEGGNEPNDPERQKNNTATDPTDVQKAGAVSGQVWRDMDHDRVYNPAAGDLPLKGVIVEVLLEASGAVVKTGSTDATGAYSITGLTPGSGYSVRFRDPVTGAYFGRPVSVDPAGGNGQVSGAVIQSLTVPAGSTRINQSLPLDPAGVVYAADTRQPLAGATVELLTASGSLVPATCMVGGVNSVTTSVGAGGIDGGYSLWLNVPVPAGCPGTAEYQLRVTAPSGYALSTTLPAQTSALAIPGGCASGTASGVCAVQAQNGPPTGSQPTTWYLRMPLNPSAGPDVVNNHIPLDSTVKPGLFVTKTGDRSRVELGDSLRYTITVKRNDSGTAVLSSVEIIDTLPAGLRYIDGTAQVDGVALADPSGKPGPALRFSLGSLGAGAQKVLTYRVRVGVGAQQGSGINRAQATSVRDGKCNGASGEVCSNEARHRVEVTGGVFATDACVVGKVYVDCNHNQMQDAEEPGIPGVRLYLQDGTSFVTDVEGKYSHCGMTPRTQVLVVDGSTLPRGSRLVTSSNRNAGDAGSLFLDLKNGELHRADFIEGSCSPTVTEQVKARRSRGDTRAVDTEKPRGRVLKFDGKPVTAPQQATDSADQRGNAGGRGEPGAVKPRRDGGQAPEPDAGSGAAETLLAPVSVMPTSSGATQPPARQP